MRRRSPFSIPLPATCVSPSRPSFPLTASDRSESRVDDGFGNGRLVLDDQDGLARGGHAFLLYARPSADKPALAWRWIGLRVAQPALHFAAMAFPLPTSADTPPRLRWRMETLRLLLLAGLCALVWIAQTDRWTAAALDLPTIYRGDALEMLARIKASSEGDLRPFRPQRIERLAAPFGADWSAYPTPDKLPLLLLGGVARLTSVFFAANLGLVLGHMLNAGIFYWVVRRWLLIRWEWAMTGALLFSYNYSVFHRGLSHFSFVFTWVVPLGLLACWLVARSSRLRWPGAGAWTCLGAGVALGCHNTYYLFFWLPLMGWALLAQWCGKRRPENLSVGLASLAAAGVTMFVVNFEYWAYAGSSDALPLLERNYGGTERYALKAIELFMPPAVHRLDLAAFLGQRYIRWSEWRGEEFFPYLGLAGITGVILLLGTTLLRLLRGRPVPGAALASGWLVAFGTVGGITNFLAFFGGLNLFRATNRIGIFIAAIVLVFLMVRLARQSARWPRPLSFAAALGLGLIGLVDQLPRRESPAAAKAVAAAVASDRTFARALEAELPDGAAIFQLPVLGFPEASPPWQLSDYEHFRPYLLSDSLRFSYGATKFRACGRWQQETARRDPVSMVRRLERLGFAALYLNRRGFEDRGQALLAALAKAGYDRQIPSPLRAQVVVLLRPAPRPDLPMARGLTLGRGWLNRPIDGVRWANGVATIFYFNPHDHPRTARFSLHLRSANARRILFHRDSDEPAVLETAAGDCNLIVNRVVLKPGLSQFTLDAGPAVREGPGANQLRTVGLLSSEVEILPVSDIP